AHRQSAYAAAPGIAGQHQRGSASALGVTARSTALVERQNGVQPRGALTGLQAMSVHQASRAVSFCSSFSWGSGRDTFHRDSEQRNGSDDRFRGSPTGRSSRGRGGSFANKGRGAQQQRGPMGWAEARGSETSREDSLSRAAPATPSVSMDDSPTVASHTSSSGSLDAYQQRFNSVSSPQESFGGTDRQASPSEMQSASGTQRSSPRSDAAGAGSNAAGSGGGGAYSSGGTSRQPYAQSYAPRAGSLGNSRNAPDGRGYERSGRDDSRSWSERGSGSGGGGYGRADAAQTSTRRYEQSGRDDSRQWSGGRSANGWGDRGRGSSDGYSRGGSFSGRAPSRWQEGSASTSGRGSWQPRADGWNRGDEEPSQRIEVEGEVVYGVSPVLAAFAAKRRTIHTLFVQEGLGQTQGEGRRKERGAPEHAIAAAEALGAAVSHISKHDLNMLTDNRPHQGLALDCSPLDWIKLDEMPQVASLGSQAVPIWLALDEVTDPHNFGAVLRSAQFLGASGVLASQKNCASLSPAVSKASAGALEAVQVHACANLPRALSEAAANGWAVFGASAEEGAEDCTAVNVGKPTILVVGSEGYGLRTTVRRACTGLIKVGGGPTAADMSSQSSSVPDSEVDSLNVSVATGILLHQLIQSTSSTTSSEGS
ncbi:hypothetical protein WJX84_011466, partial [Apatococcus fuscideae]